MTGKARMVSLILCIALAGAAAEHACVMESRAAGKNLSVASAKAMADSSAYRKLKNKLTLTQVKYQEAVKSIRLKKKNMSSFRWTPLLSLKFPESPDLAEEFEFTYKPLQIQSEMDALRHEMSVVQYDVYEEVGNKFTEVYTLQETVAFYEEQLERSQENLKRNRARLFTGEANASDIASMEKSVSSIESKLGGKLRDFEKSKKKLSDMINLDVTSGYLFLSPYAESGMKRPDLEDIKEHALERDQAYYEAKLNTQLQRISLDTNYSLMKKQYGKKMNRIDSFIKTAKAGGKVNEEALKAQYDAMLEDVDAPWKGSFRVLFIKLQKEWIKGEISGVRYIEDEPYTLYTNILEYQEAAAEEASVKKELLESVEDGYDNAITARNAYETMKKDVEDLKKDVDAGLLLNKAGEVSYEELSAMQAAYEENQASLLETLSAYTQALYSLDALSCGGVTSLMYPAGAKVKAISGGDSLVTEEFAEGAFYYIRTAVEDQIFEVGISIPEGYEPEVTAFELWIDDVRIGNRTEVGEVIRHLALDKENTEKVVLRLYNGNQFAADCEIDPAEYEGPLKVVKSYRKTEQEEEIIAEYRTESGANGMMKIFFTPAASGGEPAYYTVENKEGRILSGKKVIPIDEPFCYLSLLNGDLKELRVRFYNNAQEELCVTEFETASLKLKRAAE